MIPFVLLFSLGCGASQADGEGGCDDNDDCYTRLGDPPADANWSCEDHRCSAQAAGPFEAEIVPDSVQPIPDENGPPTPLPEVHGDRSCSTTSDCFRLGDAPADASWQCTDGECGLRGAGPFNAVEVAPAEPPNNSNTQACQSAGDCTGSPGPDSTWRCVAERCQRFSSRPMLPG